jgi:hypothetical protein
MIKTEYKGCCDMVKFGRKKKIMLVAITVGVIMLIVYFSIALIASVKLNDVITKAEDNLPYSSELFNIINEDNYNLLCHRDINLEEGKSVKIQKRHSFPFVLPWINDDQITFTYIYEVSETETNELLYGTWNANIHLKLEGTVAYYKIAEVYEAP